MGREKHFSIFRCLFGGALLQLLARSFFVSTTFSVAFHIGNSESAATTGTIRATKIRGIQVPDSTTTIHGISTFSSSSLMTTNRALQVGFANSDMNSCYANLKAGDTSEDGFLSQEEYLKFLYKQSDGIVNAKNSPTFSDLDWQLISIFYHSEWEHGSTIDLRTDDVDKLQSTVVYICGDVMARFAELKPPPPKSTGSSTQSRDTTSPTGVPSQSPSISVAPTSSEPTIAKKTTKAPQVSSSKNKNEDQTENNKDESTVKGGGSDEDDQDDESWIGARVGLVAAIGALVGVLVLALIATSIRRRVQEEKEVIEAKEVQQEQALEANEPPTSNNGSDESDDVDVNNHETNQ